MIDELALRAQLLRDVDEWRAHLRALSDQLLRVAIRTDDLGDHASLSGVLSSSTARDVDRLAIVIASKRRILGL